MLLKTREDLRFFFNGSNMMFKNNLTHVLTFVESFGKIDVQIRMPKKKQI
jgi:hypothetical protein